MEINNDYTTPALTGKPRSFFISDIASRIKFIRRSCTKKLDISKYESDGENENIFNHTDTDKDPDFHSPVTSPKKIKFKIFKKRKYSKRRKSSRNSSKSIVDLTKESKNIKTDTPNEYMQYNLLPTNNGFFKDDDSQLEKVDCKESVTNSSENDSLYNIQPILIDSTNNDTSSTFSELSDVLQKKNKESVVPSNIEIFTRDENSVADLEEPKEKIPRPPNAFMIFANEWRKHLAKQYPRDSNKTISVRLGQHWKILDEDQKKIYYRRAKLHDTEHKKKYPDYQYNPKEARIRKAQRDALKVAQRQAATAVPLLPSPSYSSISSNSSRLDMNSTSQMQQFIPAYSSQQTLGQNVGSISGGGIINANAATSTSSGSRPSSVVTANTPPRRPPPPAYPGITRQQGFHHGLESNHRDYAMGYGESNFNSLQNMYSNSPNISLPSESHTNGMFDSQYQSSSSLESSMWSGMSLHNTNIWNQQNFDMQRQHSLNDYSPFQSPENNQHSRSQLQLPTTSTPTPGNNLDDSNMFNQSDFPTDAYNYQKNQHPLNILTPKDLNRTIKSETHLDDAPLHSKEDLEQYTNSRTNTPMPPYNPNLYKHESISHVASSYHPKMSPKPHSDETRMSPYNRPNHSPKNGSSKDLIHYRMSPKIFDNKLSSPKCQKSPKSNNKSSSPTVFKFDSSRKSPKAQIIGAQEMRREQPSPEKHPLPAFTKAFSGTERGRLLATPDNTNLSLVDNNTDTSDPTTTNPDFEFLNIDLFNEDNTKINFDEINELNHHNFSDNI